MRSFLLVLIVAVVLPGCAGSGAAPRDEPHRAPRLAEGDLPAKVDDAPPPGGSPFVEVPVSSAPDPRSAANRMSVERLKERIRQVPDWACLEAGNFLFLHSTEIDPARIQEIVRRFVTLLGVMRQEFPAEGQEETPFVVRICKDKTQYEMYGGGGSSSGYWSPADGELVSYFDPVDAKRSCQRMAGLLVFAYFSRALEMLRPHDWFTVGLSDYYSGFLFNASGAFVPKRNPDFQGLAQKAIEQKTYVPLERFLRFDPAEFYGPMIQQNFAQAGSLVWFLEKQRDPEWRSLLSSYYEALRSGVQERKEGRAREGDPGPLSDEEEDHIRDAAWKIVFGGFGEEKWRRFERAWISFK